MKNITRYIPILFAILLCCVFMLYASAEMQNTAISENGEEILFSWGTSKGEQNFVKRADGKTIKDIFDENTADDLYITLQNDLTYEGDICVISDSRKLYFDVNGHELTLKSPLLKIQSGVYAHIYSSVSGGVINSTLEDTMIKAYNSNSYLVIGADSPTSKNYDLGKNLTLYVDNLITTAHTPTCIIGCNVVATGKTSPIIRSSAASASSEYRADHATFFIEGCTALESVQINTTKQTTTYLECTFINANSSDENVVLSTATGSVYTNCSFIGITPTGSEGTFTVTDNNIPTYGSAEASAVAAKEGFVTARTSDTAAYSYKKLGGEVFSVNANIKLIPASEVISVSWKCGEYNILTENWKQGSVPFLNYKISSTLSFGGKTDTVVNADAVLQANAYPTDALLGSLSLYTSIDFNLYFKQGAVSDITVDGVSVNPTEASMQNGVVYMLYTYNCMDPETAASKTFDITYTYTENGRSYPCSAKASLADYANAMLTNSAYERNYALIAALLSYVKSAAEYFGKNTDNISNILGNYMNNGVDFKYEYIAPETVTVSHKNKAVDGATFRLGNRVGFAFLLKADFEGSLTVSIGDEYSKVYNCKTGSKDVLTEDGNRWIVFDPAAYEIVTKVGDSYVGATVTVKEGSRVLFTYSIDSYINGVLNKSGVPTAKELYNYCRMAYEYYYEKKDLPYTTDAIVVNPNGTKGVVSFVLDDLNRETTDYIVENLAPKFEDLKISHAAIPNEIFKLVTETGSDGLTYFKKDADGKYIYTVKSQYNYDYWTEKAKLDYFDFINHSYTHEYQGTDDSGKDGYPVGSIAAEFLASKQMLDEFFGEKSKDVYVVPGVGKTQSQYYKDYLASLMGVGGEFIAARGTGGGPMDSDDIMNNLSWLNAPMVGYQDDTSTWTEWMDQAISEGSLMCFCIHRIYENPTTSIQINRDQADILFGYAQDRSDDGDLTIMFYYDALRYFMEKGAVDVLAQNFNDERVEVSLFYTDAAFANDKRMNYPLTVQVEVPANWKTVKYVQGENVNYAATKVVGGKTVALVNVVPGGEVATVTPEITTQNAALESTFAEDMGDGVKVDKNYFPGFVRKSVTFSMDDGRISSDTRLLDIFKPAGIKGTFNLIENTGNSSDAEYLKLYEGYEVANHHNLHCRIFTDKFKDIPIKEGVSYENLDAIQTDSSADRDYIYKSNTEGIYFVERHYLVTSYTGDPSWYIIATEDAYNQYVDYTKDMFEATLGEGAVVGFAYPFGVSTENVKQHLIDSGYLYARLTSTLKGTTNFNMPEDRFAWNCIADERCLIDVMEAFDAYADDGKLKMFSFGVHSYDYDATLLQQFADAYGNRPQDFYYATNREIFEYEDAVKALTYESGKLVNDTAVNLYVSVNGQKVIIPAYSSYFVADGMIIPAYGN